MTNPTRSSTSSLQAAIRRRAEEIYVRSGRIAGRDLKNWEQAEREIRQETTEEQFRRAVVVRVHGVQYIGEYEQASAQGYAPGEFGEGMTIPVRFAGEKMFVTRPNGMELETTIVKKVG
ncbi:MAG TPA: DUF2934 domain-containing protein [Candidatus Sulfotelmatobacter sp.]